MICRYNGAAPYIIHKVERGAYRPQEQWDSRMVFIPNLVHANLGGRIRYVVPPRSHCCAN